MRVHLDYGVNGLDVELPDHGVTVIEPRARPALADPHAALIAALRAPRGRPPLRDLVHPGPGPPHGRPDGRADRASGGVAAAGAGLRPVVRMVEPGASPATHGDSADRARSGHDQ